jgi:AraC-like DNA-binding protein
MAAPRRPRPGDPRTGEIHAPPPPAPVAWSGPYCPYIVAAGDGTRPPWAIRRRRLPFYLLVVSLDGREDITVDGRDYAIPPGGGYLIPPAVLADIGSRRGNRPVWAHCDLVFHPQRGDSGDHAYAADGRPVPRLQPGPLDIWGVVPPVPIPADLAPRFAQELPAVVADWTRGDRFAVLAATHRLAGLLHLLVAAAAPAGAPAIAASLAATTAGRLRSAEEIARASLGSGFSVADFAAAAGWSPSRFAVVYQRERGLAPGTFLRRERLRAAEELLRHGTLSLSAIARQVGYADATVFTRAFRKEYSRTPGAWRDGAIA